MGLEAAAPMALHLLLLRLQSRPHPHHLQLQLRLLLLLSRQLAYLHPLRASVSVTRTWKHRETSWPSENGCASLQQQLLPPRRPCHQHEAPQQVSNPIQQLHMQPRPQHQLREVQEDHPP